ncbi:MAG TPA: adenylyltransferase/cytidyltransferase family protein [Edaphocola sp.]|nr:adenylyltransferase/cytidyltransferase family protein [Edaphocola sp.]
MKKPYTIGYTTGVFDMFHIGHLNILKKAKERCDFLIVGISSDELVEKYKSKRPIVPFLERVQIVESIRFVDKVVVQEHRDKYEAWEAIKFDKMFVGSDWKGSKLFTDLELKFKEVEVEVVYFDYTIDTSSTLLREKLNSM